jgi:hypothetical protein
VRDKGNHVARGGRGGWPEMNSDICFLFKKYQMDLN